MLMREYPSVPRSLNVTVLRASAVMDERSTAMNDLLWRVVLADRERELAWADKNAWKFAELRELQRARKHRVVVAEALRALAARLAPVDAESAMERTPLAVEH
jgi:hypothetical protein